MSRTIWTEEQLGKEIRTGRFYAFPEILVGVECRVSGEFAQDVVRAANAVEAIRERARELEAVMEKTRRSMGR